MSWGNPPAGIRRSIIEPWEYRAGLVERTSRPQSVRRPPTTSLDQHPSAITTLRAELAQLFGSGRFAGHWSPRIWAAFLQPSMAMRGTAAPSTAGQRRQDRGRGWASGILYARSMGGHGTQYPKQGRGSGTSTAASNYAKLAPARGAWSCLPPPPLLAASSCSFVRARFPLAFLPLSTPINTCGSPALLSSRRLSSVDGVCIVRLRETRTYTLRAHLNSRPASRSACFHPPIAQGSHPCHASDSLCQLLAQQQATAAAATHNHLCAS